ncbi:MAG: cytochrome c oxidase accessory protein CcoG [Ignavibacteriae bacterium]|nr:MAG: cytochrome c oxidase accessory protein CcoG [Ignavibacteriota bacterium]
MNNLTEKPNNEDFRDHLATVTEEGKRIWIYPKKPSGNFYRLRAIVAAILLVILFGVPFIKVNGHPFMLLDLLDRKFILFGIAFGPHDFHLFVLSLIGLIISIFLFTVVYGRLFCGWVCPQTVFMEMVFRKVEYLIEGDANKQRKLNKQPWTGEKIFKKVTKHIIFFLIAFAIANALLAWVIGLDSLLELIAKPIPEVLGRFIAMIAFTGGTYFMGAYFREQVCTMICPYGRLQGVMLDPDSIVVHYDNVRGEPRTKLKKNIDQSDKGDCIECKLCVDVCPTGIDIRNGTQLECINCTACIDACNSIMTKVNRPTGLIRYASKNEIESGKRKIFTPKAIGYTIVLALLFSIISFLLTTRSDFELSIVRTAGLLAQEQPGNKISNLYDVKIINKTFNQVPAYLELQDIEGEIKVVSGDFILKPHEVAEGKFFVIFPQENIKTLNTPINVAVKANGEVIDVIQTSFLGKIKGKKFNKNKVKQKSIKEKG